MNLNEDEKVYTFDHRGIAYTEHLYIIFKATLKFYHSLARLFTEVQLPVAEPAIGYSDKQDKHLPSCSTYHNNTHYCVLI